MKTLVKFLAAASLFAAHPAFAHISATDHAHSSFATGEISTPTITVMNMSK